MTTMYPSTGDVVCCRSECGKQVERTVMADTELVQVILRDEGNGRLVCNVPLVPMFKEGDWITLKDSEDPDKRWLVTWKSRYQRAKGTIPRGWGMTDI